MDNYLQHSSRGTSWRKDRHEYQKKLAKRYYYDYETMLKKLWKMKKKYGESDEYKKLKAEYDSKKEMRAQSKVAKVQSEVARKTGSKNAKKSAEIHQRKANDAIPRHVKRMKLADITSDTLNRGKMILHKTLTNLKRK